MSLRRLIAVSVASLALFLALPAVGASGDGPQISRSVGVDGGVVILWPRVIPKSSAAVPRNAAWVVQQHLIRLVAAALPGRPVDIRPEPERVCPQAGCKGVAVGALVVHNNMGCAVVALVSGPGRSPQTLVPWGGLVELRQPQVPFREPPESFVTIRDFQRCDGLSGPLQELELAVKATIQNAFSNTTPVQMPQPVLAPLPTPVPAPAPQPPTGTTWPQQ
jgi:hypothetical protein